MDFTARITNLGFPIACVVALGYYVNTISKQSREDSKAREKELIAVNKQFAVALDKSADSIAESSKMQAALYERIHSIESKVDCIADSLKEKEN